MRSVRICRPLTHLRLRSSILQRRVIKFIKISGAQHEPIKLKQIKQIKH